MLRKTILLFSLLLVVAEGFAKPAFYPILKYGARTDVPATEAIQKAIDAAGAAGGGVVYVPKGTWTTGTLWLRSHVELYLADGAVLKGSTLEADYNRNDAFPENFWSDGEEWSGGHLIIAYKVEDVAIKGEGTIDGSGPEFFGECEEDSRFPWYKYGLKLHPVDRSWFRPGPMVAMFLSKDIRMEGVTLKDTPCWTAHFRCCDGLDIRNVTIDADRTIANSDGFSIDCMRNVTVKDCIIRTGDDGLAIRASCTILPEEHPCENIHISNCDIWSCCYGIRFGIGSGTVRNVEVVDCRIHEAANGFGFNPAWIPGKKGVYIEDIRFSRCDVRECARPVESNAVSDDWRIRNISFEDCRFESLLPVAFSSPESRHPENVTFRNCTRKHLDALRVRHHRGWGGERSKKFIEGGPVTNLRLENCQPSEEITGLLVLSFDDRNFDDWVNALPIFEKYGAHATFFVSGPINGDAVRTMKRLSEAGHSVGLHGLRHANADDELAVKSPEQFYKEEIEPQREACRVAYIPITSYAYPNCRRTDESDSLFRKWGFAHVRGGHSGVAPFDPKGEKQEGLKPVHTVDRVFFPASESPLRYRLDTVIAGEAYHTDIGDILACIRRAAERKEVFVLTSHGISPDAKSINMKTEWLERILATAQECGLRAVGFDELP
ncbi:MAG: polysaccharide deacetylase family protein [Bacteroidales bacterium]|nr:polysaccharide deacetylase family protein [Bacteroidales bacterium]